MANIHELYYPKGFFDFREKMKEKNDKLEKKLTEKRNTWLKKYNGLITRTDKLDLYKLNPKEAIDIQSYCLAYHEDVRIEIDRFISQLKKAMNKKAECEVDAEVFYELRKDQLGLKGKYGLIEILIDGVSSQWDRTCKLYQLYIDFLDDLKSLIKTLKYKVSGIEKNALYIFENRHKLSK